MAGLGDSREVDIRDSRGVQAGDRNVQYFIDTYIAQLGAQPPVARRGGRVVGEVPRRAPAFQPRPELTALLTSCGSGTPVVRAVTGMRGVGKTQLAAAYARD